MFDVITFYVEGVPRPQGSKKVMRGYLVEASKHVKPWRKKVSEEASEHFEEPAQGAVHVELTFSFTRPKSHLKKDGTLRAGYPLYMTRTPDIDKLARAVLDALTGIAYRDDSQVITLDLVKVYGSEDNVTVKVTSIENM